MAKVFISYSHRDVKWLKKLLVHLRPLERDAEIDVWADTRIAPGDEWLKELEHALATATVAVLLVSADFLASDFIMRTEVPALLTKAEQRGCRILSLILRPCLFSNAQLLQKFQAVNSPKTPLNALKAAAAEEYLVQLARVILEQVEEPHPSKRREERNAQAAERGFKGDARVDALVRGVRLADWDAAQRAALQIVAMTDSAGRNAAFEALLAYRDCQDDDERLWGAIQTIESCVTLAPWLIGHEQLSGLLLIRLFQQTTRCCDQPSLSISRPPRIRR